MHHYIIVYFELWSLLADRHNNPQYLFILKKRASVKKNGIMERNVKRATYKSKKKKKTS